MKPSDLDEAKRMIDQLAQCDRLLAAETLASRIHISRDAHIDMDEVSSIRKNGGAVHTDHDGNMSCGNWKSPFIKVSLDDRAARDFVIEVRKKTLERLREIGVEVACAPSDEYAEKAPTARREAPLAWWAHETDAILTQLYGAPVQKKRRIVTRNSDGGTSAWSKDEARELARSITEILDDLPTSSPALPKKPANGLFDAPSGTRIFTPHSRRVWVQDGQIETSNAYGSISAWSEDEARALAKSLTAILDALNGFQKDSSAAQKKSGGAKAPPPSNLPWYRRPPR